MTLDTAYVTGNAADTAVVDPLAADIPDSVSPGNPIEAFWGNEVVAALAEHEAEIQAMIPTGTIWQYAGQTAPARWLVCDGTDYPTTGATAKLFGVIGYMYGANGSNFRVPNFKGRVPAGVSGGDPAFNIGNMAGQRDAPLIRHAHDMKNHTHYIEIASEGDHSHYSWAQQAAVRGGKGSIGEPDAWPVYPAGVPQPPGVDNAGIIFTASSFLVTTPPNLPVSIMPRGWINADLVADVPASWSGRARDGYADWHSHGLNRNDGPNDNTTTEAGTAGASSDANLSPYTTVNFLIRL